MKPFTAHFDEPYLKPSPRGAEQTDPSSAGTTLRPSSFLGKAVGRSPTIKSTKRPGLAHYFLFTNIASTCAGRHNFLKLQVKPQSKWQERGVYAAPPAICCVKRCKRR